MLAMACRGNFAQYLKEDRSKDANFEKGMPMHGTS